jgi:hypothetical protein
MRAGGKLAELAGEAGVVLGSPVAELVKSPLTNGV